MKKISLFLLIFFSILQQCKAAEYFSEQWKFINEQIAQSRSYQDELDLDKWNKYKESPNKKHRDDTKHNAEKIGNKEALLKDFGFEFYEKIHSFRGESDGKNLAILAEIAEMFSDTSIRAELTNETDPVAVHNLILAWQPQITA